MLRAYESYSFKRGKKRSRAFLFSFVKFLILSLVLYALVATFLVGSYRVDSVSMAPGLVPGERVFATPLVYGIKLPLGGRRIRGIEAPRRRWDRSAAFWSPWCDFSPSREQLSAWTHGEGDGHRLSSSVWSAFPAIRYGSRAFGS